MMENPSVLSLEGARANSPASVNIGLAEPVVPDPVPVIDQARAVALRADIWFRGIAVVVVCLIFIGLNWAVMSFVHDAFANDVARMAAQPPMASADRLVTTSVLMSLIGATVVQTGVGFIAIMSYLFPKQGR